MRISGKILINGQWREGEAGTFYAVNPATGKQLETEFSKASKSQVDEAVAAAESAFHIFRNTSLEQRAQFLNTCADEIMALGDDLLDMITAETGYPLMRGQVERARTCGQLRMFAEYIVKGEYLNARIDTAMPDRQPIPRPDLRYLNQALGPVAVFAVSNFPLAYSVAGGDTASAFAAGCPVLVKGHSSHPGTSELVAQAIAVAIEKCNLPGGVLSLLSGEGRIVGTALVEAPAVKAVGFTGSISGGTALCAIASARPEPIPVFAEMGSNNPVILLPEALNQSAEDIATGFAASLILGSGQFCVNPGLILAIESDALEQFIATTSAALSEVGPCVMLNENICRGYAHGTKESAALDEVEVLATGVSIDDQTGSYAQTMLMSTNASYYMSNPGLQEEIFGPASLLVKCKTMAELLNIVRSLKGQLTGTIHAAEGELENYKMLTETLSLRVGRMVINGFPTGVEVCPAMVHGGPFPASSDQRFTAVGTAAIARFVRPVCYQNYPESLLPNALRDSNPLEIPRVVNGEMSK